MKQKTRFIISLLTAVSCWLFFAFTSELYLYTDNVGVAVVLNGYFDNPLSQYQHPLFCLLVNILAHLLPFADMFMVTAHILIFFELLILMFLLSEKTCKETKWEIDDYLIMMISVLFCLFLSAGLNIWRANYTIQAGSILFTGWLILVMGKDKKWIIIGTFFIAFGYMMRKEVGMLFLPFASLLVLLDVFSTKKEEQRPLCRYVSAYIVIFLLMVSQITLNHVEPFAAAERYNIARTDLVDFPVRAWSEDESFFEISREDYNAATSWLFTDTDVMNAEHLEDMAEIGSINKFEYTSAGLRSALLEMEKVAGKTDVYMSVMVILCVFVSLWNAVTQKSWWLKGISISALLGAFLILLYFTFRGRAPLRVWQPVLFGVMLVELGVILRGQLWIGKTVRSFSLLLLCIILYYSAGQVIAHVKFHDFQTALLARIEVDDSDYEKTFDDGALYIWPNWHAAIPEYFGDMGKLATTRVMEHNIALGDWTSGQPYYTGFLERIGHPNPIKDLTEGKNTYIMSDSDYILDFLRFHYGKDIELVACWEVNGTMAYRVERRRIDEP